MLRRGIGDLLFFSSMRNYFEIYKYENASTDDFISVVEKTSGKQLDKFFDQWVYSGEGIIEVKYDWRKKRIGQGKILNTLMLEQTQDEYDEYHFKLDIKLSNDEQFEIKTFEIDSKKKIIEFETENIYYDILFDPNVWLLGQFFKKD